MAIGLALSGGGLRATLFHLGVVRALRDANVLKDVTHICSVSGGSILAAHLVLNWEDYLGEGFEKRAKEILDFCEFDVRNHIVRRYPSLMIRWFASKVIPFRLVPPRGATDLLQEYYGRLFGEATLEQLRAPKGGTRPLLHILTTNLTTATLCSFGTDGFQSEAAVATGRSSRPKVHITAATPTLSFAVGASSAFPGMFSPLRLTAAELGKYDAALEPKEQFVTDGGVYDNLGVRKFLSDPDGLARLDRVFVSNAGMELKTGGGREHVGMIRTALRASDILSHRVHQLESASMERLTDGSKAKFIPIHIRDVVTREEDPGAIHENTQEWLRWIRTDLDRFSPFEMHCLIQHGWGLARKALRKTGEAGADAPAWAPCPSDGLPSTPVKQMKLLSKSVGRRMRFFSMKDRISWVHAAIALLALGLGAWGYKARADHLHELGLAKLKAEDDTRRAEEETARVEEARKEAEKRHAEETAKAALRREKEVRLAAVVQKARDYQHSVSVEVSYRRAETNDWRGFKVERDKPAEGGEEQKSLEAILQGQKDMLAHASLVTLYCLLKDDSNCLWHLYREHDQVITGAMSKKWNYDETAAKWRWRHREGVYSAWPNLWCFAAINRLISKIKDPPPDYREEIYAIATTLGMNMVRQAGSLKDFHGDESGVWLAVSNQKDRNRNHPYVASIALTAMLEYVPARNLVLPHVDPEHKDSLPDPQGMIQATCARLVADWEKNRWAVMDEAGEARVSQALSMLVYGCLLRVDHLNSAWAGMTDDMRRDIGRIVLAARDLTGKGSVERLNVETTASGDSKAVSTEIKYNWITWAIDCVSEWRLWQERNGKSDKEILETIEILHSLLTGSLENSPLIAESHKQLTEDLAEVHLVLCNLISRSRP